MGKECVAGCKVKLEFSINMCRSADPTEPSYKSCVLETCLYFRR